MNIFLDTNILFHDPFWKNPYNKVILDMAKSGKIDIYISAVVIKELHKNYLKNLQEQLKQIINASKEIDEKYSIHTYEAVFKNEDKLVEEFKAFYKKLHEKSIIKVIEADNDLLPEIIERAVWRKKPFTESKTELKDAIIWLSYVSYIKQKEIDLPYLLTGNTNDFCDKTDTDKDTAIFEVHKDLQKDSDKFKVVKSSKVFVEKIIKKIQIENKNNFTTNLNQIDENFAFTLLSNKSSVLKSKIERQMESQDLNFLFSKYYNCTGYYSVKVEHLSGCEQIAKTILEDSCIVTGILNVECEVEAYDYISYRDRGEDKYEFASSTSCLAKVHFSIIVDTDLHPQEWTIEEVEVENILGQFTD